MPFNFDEFEVECLSMTDEQLAAAKQKYTRTTSSSTTGLAVSSIFLGPFALFSIAAASAAASNATVKIKIINAEMRKPHREYRSTRMRDVVGGVAISSVTAGLGSHMTHVANHAISQTNNHALTHTQSLIATGVGEGAQQGSKFAVNHHLSHEDETGSTSTYVTKQHRRCDECYEHLGDEAYYYHCDDCADFVFCPTCNYVVRSLHTKWHTFTMRLE